MKLYAYKQGSKSAIALATALGIKRILHKGDLLVVKGHVINWGSSKFSRKIVPERDVLGQAKVLNEPECVAQAANKLKTFKALSAAGVSVPEWTTDEITASEWLLDGYDVVSRLKLTGHSGEGIVIQIAKEDTPFVKAPLHTKYIKKDQEYRIHVFQGDAFFIQRKARKLDVPNDKVDWQVRNLAGGFIFANKDVDVSDVAKQEAINAVAALGLDFGAVDIILGKDGKYYVLEVNTACGLEGTTLEKYVEKFQAFKG